MIRYPVGLAYDRATALLIVDVQNDFADPGGSLVVGGGEAIIPFLNDQIGVARRAGGLVAYTQDWHPPVTPHFARDGGIWPVHCVMDTWGAELHPNLLVDGPSVHKGSRGEDGYSGFTMRDPLTGQESPTELDAILRARRDRGGRDRRPGDRLLRPGQRARRDPAGLPDQGPAGRHPGGRPGAR